MSETGNLIAKVERQEAERQQKEAETIAKLEEQKKIAEQKRLHIRYLVNRAGKLQANDLRALRALVDFALDKWIGPDDEVELVELWMAKLGL